MIKFRPRDIGCWRYPVFDEKGDFVTDTLMFDVIEFRDVDALKKFLSRFFKHETMPEFKIENGTVVFGLCVGYILS